MTHAALTATKLSNIQAVHLGPEYLAQRTGPTTTLQANSSAASNTKQRGLPIAAKTSKFQHETKAAYHKSDSAIPL